MEHNKIDFVYIGKLIKDYRKLYCKVLAVAAVVGVIIALSIPKSYVTRVTMVSDAGGSSLSGTLGAMASLVGVRVGDNGNDTFYPEIYPDIINSDDFISQIWEMKVNSLDHKIDTTLYHYVDKCQKSAWWDYPLKFVSWTLGLINGSGKKTEAITDERNIRLFTQNEDLVAKDIRSMISCSIDQKTDLISIEVEAQDPNISAQVADSVLKALQGFIVKYRTNKSASDLEYMQNLFDEKKSEYELAQKQYAQAADANSSLVLKSASVKLDLLENEMELKYGVYSDVAQQLELAKAKLQEKTPVFAVIQSSSVHLKKTKPKRAIIVLSFLLASFLGLTLYLLNKKGKLA